MANLHSFHKLMFCTFVILNVCIYSVYCLCSNFPLSKTNFFQGRQIKELWLWLWGWYLFHNRKLTGLFIHVEMLMTPSFFTETVRSSSETLCRCSFLRVTSVTQHKKLKKLCRLFLTVCHVCVWPQNHSENFKLCKNRGGESDATSDGWMEGAEVFVKHKLNCNL